MESGGTKDQSVTFDPDRLRRGILKYCEDMERAGIRHVLWPVSESVDSSLLATQSAADGSVSSGEAMAAGAESPGLSQTEATASSPSRGEARPLAETREEALAALAQQVSQCRLCPELVQNRTQTVFGVGNPHAELVFIGEAPGVDEDKQGVPFVGRAGQLLTAMITNGMGMRREDVYICNILRCRPPNNRTPNRDEADRCRPWLDATLAVIQPKLICCLGSVAAQNLLKTDVPIGRLRGKIWEYQQAKVICTYHPAFLLRNPAMKREAWEDLKLLLHVMGRPIPRRSS